MAQVSERKGELVIEVLYSKRPSVYGYVRNNNDIQWSSPENVPKHIKKHIGPRLAQEIVRRRLYGRP